MAIISAPFGTGPMERRGLAGRGQPAHRDGDPLPLAPRPAALDGQQAADLGVVVEDVALDRVEQRLGQVVEVEPGRVVPTYSIRISTENSAPGKRAARPRQRLAEELIEQGLLVVLGTGWSGRRPPPPARPRPRGRGPCRAGSRPPPRSGARPAPTFTGRAVAEHLAVIPSMISLAS